MIFELGTSYKLAPVGLLTKEDVLLLKENKFNILKISIIMKIKAISKGDYSKTFSFQEFLGFKLPNDYFNFLVDNDGATIDEGYFYVKGLEDYILLEIFYGIEKCIKIHKEFKDDLPAESLIIGRDFGGGMILLVTVENGDFSKGIYYYDHSHFFEASNSENNTYFICETFNEFIDILRNTILE